MPRWMFELSRALLIAPLFALAACGEELTLTGVGDRTDPTDPPPGGTDPIVVGLYTLEDTTATGDTVSITEFSLDDWLVPDGNEVWRVEDGALIGEGLVAQTALLHGTADVDQATWIEVDVDHADDGGIVVRAQDDDSYYLIAIRDDSTAVGPSGADSNVELYWFDNGVWESFADYGGVDVDWPRGELATIKVWVIQDVVLIFFNDVLVQSGQDARFATGALGVRTNAFFHTQLVPSKVRYRAMRWGTF